MDSRAYGDADAQADDAQGEHDPVLHGRGLRGARGLLARPHALEDSTKHQGKGKHNGKMKGSEKMKTKRRKIIKGGNKMFVPKLFWVSTFLI